MRMYVGEKSVSLGFTITPPKVNLWGQTLMLGKKVWLTVSTLGQFNCVPSRLWSELCAEESSSAHSAVFYIQLMQSGKYCSPGNCQAQTMRHDLALKRTSPTAECSSSLHEPSCSWANLKTTWSLEVFTYGLYRNLVTTTIVSIAFRWTYCDGSVLTQHQEIPEHVSVFHKCPLKQSACLGAFIHLWPWK